MAGVDKFTREQFEEALPKHKTTGEPLWERAGVQQGEYVYKVSFGHPLGLTIFVRSSVKTNGESADCGKDSIRCWLITPDGKPAGSKLSKYTTRVPGWQDRLTKVLRTLARVGKHIGQCECGKMQGVFKVKRDGPNKGRWFHKCSDFDCKKTQFQFLTDTNGEFSNDS